MSISTSKLRLGPLPKTETVKVTFSCTTALKAELDRYAALHAKTFGEPIDTTTLIPHMLEAFMARDRVFERSSRPVQSNPLIIHAKPMNHVSDPDTPEPVHSKK
jgi:hypothetical protein